MDVIGQNPLPDFIRLKSKTGTSEHVYYSARYEDLPSEFQALAEKELNETEEKKAKGIKRLKEFLKREELPDVDDHTLILALRVGKYDKRKSETRLKKFLRTRRLILDKVADLDLKTAEMVIEDSGIGILPFRDKHGRVIVFTRPNAMNDDLYSMDHVLLTGVACTLALLSYPLTSVTGIAYIGDCKFRTASSYMSLLKSYHKYMWTFLDLPIRIGRADIINEHFVTRWFYNIIRPFLNSKVIGRISFCGHNLENLQKAYHGDILPEEFGGNMGPLDPTFYKHIALDCLKKLKAESQALREATQ